MELKKASSELSLRECEQRLAEANRQVSILK